MLNRAWDGVEETYHSVTDRAGQVREGAEHYTQESPLTASLVSFGVGVGLGLLLTSLLTPQRRPSHWYDSYLGCDRARGMEDMMHRYLPDSITRRMGV
jgi:hypothetical protein